MEEKVFRQGIYLIETITGKAFGKNQVEIYRTLLEDIPESRFITGINNMLRERVFSNLPMPAEIREYSLGLKEDEMMVRVNRAKLLLNKGISKAGIYNDVVFEDPIIHLCIDSIGGWINFCKKSLKEVEDWLKWDFPKLYRSFSTRKQTTLSLVLEGKGDKDLKEVCYIGDREKYLKWSSIYIEHKSKENPKQLELLKRLEKF
ncbi:MAG: DUF6475 domain-containing protein [Fusobacterium sp.]|uniref:DUF6475 domain-containing protein n=1 Tax=Fusobacterium sp. TaxID=68766 RepID=UPI002A75159D|nr:DUF6475 domain-containing protein [Fusobacterium sp.]MDY2980846.1 DUF6475 domain-containing protein [Fusobacterium sp.]